MKKILVLEDDSNILSNIRELLEAEKYSVMTALNGKEGLEKLNSQKPDLILCDIMMPYINGVEFFNLVKENYETRFIPFVFLTARADIYSIREGLNLGVDDYVTKPFSATDLLKVIQVRLEKQRQYAEQVESLVKNINMYIPHELRTPLVSIIGYSQLIISDINSFEKGDVSEMAEKILWSARRLHSRIEKFIYFSNLNLPVSEKSKMLSDHTARIDDAFVEGIIIDHYYLCGRAASILLSIEPADLFISDQQLEILLKEILENAAKFSDFNSHINVEGVSEGDEYNITIKNKGIGMTKEEIENIGLFNQFNREIYSQDGNGLGLSIVKRILQINNGSITFESEKNKYAIAKIKLRKRS